MKNICTILIIALLANFSFAAKPNIIVFLIDDMGAMDTSVPFIADENGQPKAYPLNEMYRTPNMETLSERGTRFSKAYAMSVCSPSRVSIMTGQTSARHHCTNFIKPEANNGGKYGPKDWDWLGLDSKDVTMPKILQANGYKTIYIGKAHFAPKGKEGADPLVLGYDVNIGGCAWGQPGSYLGTANFGNKGKGLSRGVPHLEKYHGKDIFLTEALTIEAIAEIKKAKAEGKPFLLSMSHYGVHSPFTSDKRFAANYADAKAPKDWKSFATMIEGIDKSLGDLMKTLEEEGIAENTLIIFAGDNGTDSRMDGQSRPNEVGNAAPLRGMKATRFEGGMRIPFIISWAKPDANSAIQKEFKVKANGFNNDLVAIYDIFSTALDVAGVKAPEGYALDAVSMFDTIANEGSKANKERTFLMNFPHEHRNSYFTVFVDGNWKITNDQESSSYELFDLAADISESNNLFESNPEKANEMIAKMEAAMKDAGAQLPDFSKASGMVGKGKAAGSASSSSSKSSKKSKKK